MGESRQDLLAWINDLLQLNYSKVEQCGTGAVYCQILDSIYQDVPMSRVKFNAKQEYEYIDNFKVFQAILKRHAIDKPVLVEKLVKCKMQDNLEFLQWLKKYWDINFPGGTYDPVARRKGGPAGAASAPAPRANPAVTRGVAGAARVGAGTSSMTSRPGAGARPPPGVSAAAGTVPATAINALTSQMSELKVNLEGLEKERDFYFNKLRSIEIEITGRLESATNGTVPPEGQELPNEGEQEFLRMLQAILYSTEEGFEAPDPNSELPPEDEEETF